MPVIPEKPASDGSPEKGDSQVQQPQEPELPPFTLKNVLLDIVHGSIALIIDPRVVRIVAPIVVILTSFAGKFIISKVPYTEIDFSTYMQQIELVNEGELDYNQIFGDTGPIVYPAGFVQVYQVLHWLTEGGENLKPAQVAFSYLLAFTNLLAVVTFTTAASVQPWVIYLLLLSKRLFSIYILRLFNDCFTTVAMIGVTVFLQQASVWSSYGSLISYLFTLLAADLFSLAISVKMNALLYLPGFAVVSYFLVGGNLLKFITVLLVIPLVQVLVGWKFLLPLFDDETASTIRWNYISQAFNFSRKFLYKWTVNWKFVSEEVFLSDAFSNALLVGQAVVLLGFIFTRWIHPKVTGKSVSQLLQDAVSKPFSATESASKGNLYLDHKHGPRLILLVLATSNVTGVLFSRSLHYQFLSWYCWQLPFLLFSTGWNFVVCGFIWAAHEYCWITFPSTPLSSALLVSILSVVLFGVWNNEANWFVSEEEKEKKNV